MPRAVAHRNGSAANLKGYPALAEGGIRYSPAASDRLSTRTRTVSVCFVCLGNICRSPTAAGVMRQLISRAGLESHIVVDSAGTSGYHIGDAPDRRARAVAARRGIDVGHRARQFKREDFEKFDYVLAMDEDNLDALTRLARGQRVQKPKLALLRSYDPQSPPGAAVPDPYYGGDDGFEDVIDLCTAACERLLEVIRKEHGL